MKISDVETRLRQIQRANQNPNNEYQQGFLEAIRVIQVFIQEEAVQNE
jgi:hypothetical protein